MSENRQTDPGQEGKVQEVGTVWQPGDTLVFGVHGVCRITGTETEKDGTVDYVLTPVYDERSRLLVPVNSEILLGKMKPVLSRSEVDQFIQDIPSQPSLWVDKPSTRKELYHSVLRRGDRKEISCVIKTLYLHEKEMAGKGKHLYRSDEQVLQDATKMLYEEFAYVIGITPDEVEDYIKQRLSA